MHDSPTASRIVIRVEAGSTSDDDTQRFDRVDVLALAEADDLPDTVPARPAPTSSVRVCPCVRIEG